MEAMTEFFSNAIIPGSRWLWWIAALGLCAYSLYKARVLVSKL